MRARQCCSVSVWRIRIGRCSLSVPQWVSGGSGFPFCGRLVWLSWCWSSGSLHDAVALWFFASESGRHSLHSGLTWCSPKMVASLRLQHLPLLKRRLAVIPAFAYFLKVFYRSSWSFPWSLESKTFEQESKRTLNSGG